ncbi:MAG TPA: sodium:solute symporter, partial [Verrucomicrobiota bacterium]|nr:sodium:solute symporter [Verrucomicrobiota bacterium]
MPALDYLVLIGTMVGIAVYGVWKTRGRRSLADYLKGDKATGWGTIGLSVMATQASAITFLSTPGQAYEKGVGFVQIYFGLPLALVIISVVFLPIYRRLNVFTAYEYLGKRFDAKTRVLGAVLFLLQRGLAAGITIYAPAIVLAKVLNWPLNLTIVGSGVLVILYTASGGNDAVNLTQKWQMGVIFVGMIAAFVVLMLRMPEGLGLGDMLSVAGTMGKLEAVDFSFDPNNRYTLWSGILGGLFLSLSYFGTDQSQVQRYLSGGSLRQSRLGLMFNAVMKIPMQFFILLLGALVFVLFQFDRPPLFFNEPVWQAEVQGEHGAELRRLEQEFNAVHAEKEARVRAWLEAKASGDGALEAAARAEMLASHERSQQIRQRAIEIIKTGPTRAKSSDADYVFITFILNYLPHGLIGLLIAVIFAAGLSSTSSELSALGSTTTVDLYRHLFRKNADERHYVRASRGFTVLWGAVALGFALVVRLVENLIEAVNILGSLFYGVVLGIFLLAFFFKRVGGTAVFFGALIAEVLVIVGYFTIPLGFLW